jgi:AGZA family xanthine/uracil permease-like MFS transporter
MSLDIYFEISKRKTSLRVELVAGLTTYFSLAYILIVNPAILSKAGIDPSAALFATAVASGLTTILMDDEFSSKIINSAPHIAMIVR